MELMEGYGAGLACINNGMDCILKKMEEGDSIVGEREGEIGTLFYEVAANRSRYNTGSRIDIVGISMMGGVGKVVEVGGKELVTAAFVEYGGVDSDIHCGKESKGTSKYIGEGVLGRYDVYEDENSRTKMYAEGVLRAGQVSNSFKGEGVRDAAGKEYKYDDADAIYGGCEAGGRCKYKVKEKIELEGSLRYMFGYHGGKDVELAEVRTLKLEDVLLSNRV